MDEKPVDEQDGKPKLPWTKFIYTKKHLTDLVNAHINIFIILEECANE